MRPGEFRAFRAEGRGKVVRIRACWIWAFLLGFMALPAYSAEIVSNHAVQGVAEQMKAHFQGVEDYSSDLEQTYFTDRNQTPKYRFKYSFKRPGKIRVDFLHPHSGLIVFYQRGEKKATLRPFPTAPSIKVSLSIGNSIMKTPTGQGIHQTDMIFFIDFLFRNLAQVQQEDNQFQEECNQVNFLFWAREYIKGPSPEKYRIFVSTQNWLPLRIERYSPEGQPVETSVMGNYVINSHLDDLFFIP